VLGLMAWTAPACTTIPSPVELEPLDGASGVDAGQEPLDGGAEGGGACARTLEETAFAGASVEYATAEDGASGAWRFLAALRLSNPTRFAFLEMYTFGTREGIIGVEHAFTPDDLDPDRAVFWMYFGDDCNVEARSCRTYYAPETGRVMMSRSATDSGFTAEFLWSKVRFRAADFGERRRATLRPDGACVSLDRLALTGTVDDATSACGSDPPPFVCGLANRRRAAR
jgi:hypothetical protein